MQPQTKQSPTIQPLLSSFKKYLETSKQVSASSEKNYLSDVNRFLNWLAGYSGPNQPNQPETIQAQQITPASIKLYQNQLQPLVNPATYNRHQSSLRCFGQFLKTSGRLKEDPTQTVSAPRLAATWLEILKLFQRFLKHEHLANSTIKNYLSDTNSYLLWARNYFKITEGN